jgi:endonuclease-3
MKNNCEQTEEYCKLAKLVCLILSANTRDHDCITCTGKLAEMGLLNLKVMAREENRARIKKIIRSCGYHRKRSHFLVNMAQTILKKHNAKIPEDIEQLIKIDGVSRKTALLAQNEYYGINSEGIACDIHVIHNCASFGFIKLKSKETKIRSLHVETALRHWIGRHDYQKVNKLFGSFSQLFTQLLKLRSSKNDDKKEDTKTLEKICKSMTDYIYQSYHVELLFCLISSLRRHYRSDEMTKVTVTKVTDECV